MLPSRPYMSVLEKLMIPKPLTKLPAFYGIPKFTGPCREPDESSPHPPILCVWYGNEAGSQQLTVLLSWRRHVWRVVSHWRTETTAVDPWTHVYCYFLC
jgi:hypothetical protein